MEHLLKQSWGLAHLHSQAPLGWPAIHAQPLGLQIMFYMNICNI